MEFARKEGFGIDDFVETTISTRRDRQREELSQLIQGLEKNDRFVVSELSRLGRSLGQVIAVVDELVKRKINFVAIKESIRFEGKQTLQTKVTITMFALLHDGEASTGISNKKKTTEAAFSFGASFCLLTERAQFPIWNIGLN